MMNFKKSNVITAIICAVTLSTVSFYTGVSAASSSVSYKSQGKIVFDNNTDDTSDDVVFDASDFKTISDMVISGKKQVGTELNKYPSVNFNLSSSVPDFAELANAVDILTDDTTDTTSDKILKDYTAYVKGNKIKGAIPSKAAATYTPGRSDQTIAAGQYLSGVQTIKGDSNLQAANIISGKTIFGVTGTATTESHRIESNKSVTISNTSGSITPTTGNNAMAAVSYSVQGVDAAKIVSGQSILGVSGNHTCSTCTQTHRTPQSSKTVTPTAGGLTVTPDSGYNSMDQVVINGDGDLIAENIKSGVEIFGVTGTLNSSPSEIIKNQAIDGSADLDWTGSLSVTPGEVYFMTTNTGFSTQDFKNSFTGIEVLTQYKRHADGSYFIYGIVKTTSNTITPVGWASGKHFSTFKLFNA